MVSQQRLKDDFLVLTKCLYHVLEESPSLSVNARSVIISLSFNSLIDARLLFASTACKLNPCAQS